MCPSMPELPEMSAQARVVITGVGLSAPNGNSLGEFRASLLAGRSGVQAWEIRHVGKTLAGVCSFDALRYQSRKDLRRGTRAGSIAIYCANEAVRDFFLKNMSSRAAKMLTDDMEALGPVRLRDVDEAQATLVNMAKDLAAKGEITISKGKAEEELVY